MKRNNENSTPNRSGGTRGALLSARILKLSGWLGYVLISPYVCQQPPKGKCHVWSCLQTGEPCLALGHWAGEWGGRAAAHCCHHNVLAPCLVGRSVHTLASTPVSSAVGHSLYVVDRAGRSDLIRTVWLPCSCLPLCMAHGF